MSDGDSLSRSGATGHDAGHAALSSGHLWLIGALISSVVLLAIAGNGVRESLRYERSAVLAGEWWRLLTGHLVHTDLRHLSLNIAGTGLVAVLFGRDYSVRQWLFILLLSAAAIDVAFVFYEPQLQWYVGLSGILHGGIAAGLIAWLRYENRVLTLAVTALLIAKLCWEQYRGALPFSGDMPVVVDAHFYGAIGGALAAASIALLQQRWPRRSTSL